MNPAFGTAQLQMFLPVFRRSAARVRETISLMEARLFMFSIQLSQKWKDTIQLEEKTEGCIINVNQTLSRMTLDVLGEGRLLAICLIGKLTSVDLSCFRPPLRSPQQQWS